MSHRHLTASLFILFLLCCSTTLADVRVIQTLSGPNTTLGSLPQPIGINFAPSSVTDILGMQVSSKPTEAVVISNISFSINTDDRQNLETQQKSKSFFDEARKYYDSGLYDSALSSINKSLENYRNNSNAWTFKGVILQASNKSFEAIENYDIAVRLDPGNVAAWNDRGVAFYKISKFDEAISSYNNATLLNPSNSIVSNNRDLAIRKSQT